MIPAYDDAGGPPDPDGRRPARRQADADEARRRATPPAVALIAVGAVNVGLGLLGAAAGFVGVLNMGAAEGVICLCSAAASSLTVRGGFNLLRLGSLAKVRTGSVLAMVPCLSLCLLFGLPIGVWALVTATGPDVRAAFRGRQGRAGND